MAPPLAAVVPTLGQSPWLAAALAALAREGCETVLVHSGPLELDAGAAATRVIRVFCPLGFAAASDLGLAAVEDDRPYVATVNDDAVVEPGWATSLVAALDADPGVAAVQGLNLRLGDGPERVDGAGIGWNRGWQAVQLGHGEPPPEDATTREVWGVSATAAVYRRSALAGVALDGVALDGDRTFEARLGSYYEDVELAGRLRAAGWRALAVPAARARHAGSASGRRLRFAARHLLVSNRWLVLARLLGRGLWPRVPRILLRDLADLWHALGRGEPAAVAATAAGWLRAATRLPAFARLGPPLVPLSDLRRLSPSPPP